MEQKKVPPQLATVLEALHQICQSLYQDGWQKSSMGCSKNERIDYNERFDFYKRVRKLRDVTEVKQDENCNELVCNNKYFNEESTTPNQKRGNFQSSKNQLNQGFSDGVGNSYGKPKGKSDTEDNITPTINSSDKNLEEMDENSLKDQPVVVPTDVENLPILSDFHSYPSLLALRSDKPATVIAFDTEWFYPNGDKKRAMLSWQFACIVGENLVEFIFLRKHEQYNLSLELALGRILDSLNLPCTLTSKIRVYLAQEEIDPTNGKPLEVAYPTREEALEHAKIPYEDEKLIHPKLDWSKTKHLPVILLCHAGKADLTTLDQSASSSKAILHYCTEVQGGIISLQPILLYPASVNPKRSSNSYRYPVTLRFCDTMCHAPTGMKSLKALGQTVGYQKVSLEDGIIEQMNELLVSNPRLYFEYASTDSVVTLLYASALYGYNRLISPTITSGTARVMKHTMMGVLNVKKNKDFDYKYRGIQTVGHGMVPRQDRPGYIESTSKEPISDKANTIQYYCSQAYHGGYNSSSDIGYFPEPTFDYDLKNAYPTAMCLVPDVDWDICYTTEIVERELTLDYFRIPMKGKIVPIPFFVAYVRFSFPEGVKYPCLPVNVDGVPIYPRTSDGINGVYVCGPEVVLALQLGAKIYCEHGYMIQPLIAGDGYSFSLRSAVKQLVTDRNQAKDDHGKASLEELILKVMVNSGYGKVAQNVVQKDTWTALTDTMEDLGCSGISNPASAMMITSIVRAVLLAAQNQCHEWGYMAGSTTTDGFISNISEDVLKSLDLYGLREIMGEARLFLTDGEDSELWETKHWQDDLVNFTTRGNVSLSEHGVCAHNSTKSGFPADSYEDRLWLMKSVLGRTGTVDYSDEEWPSLKDLVHGEEFSVRTVLRHIRMDFDMKRKPDRNSFVQKFVDLDGERYEIANFSTLPFENVAEFKEYRTRKASVSCLRTMKEWEIFWFKTDAKSSGARCQTRDGVKDMDWTILFSCIIGHRAGFFEIPKLNELSGQERCDWINSHNTSRKAFTVNDWKNAGRNSRQANMLPMEMIMDKLKELQNDD